MADLRTIFTDDDGDGVYDDVHVVNVMEDTCPPPVSTRPQYHHYNTSTTNSSYGSFFSRKTKLKIIGIIAAILCGISALSYIASFLLVIFLR